jgi:ferredoxin-nitrate reductase
MTQGSKGRPCDVAGMAYELILKTGAVRWPPNEQHPRGTERLYEDPKFWTGITGCDSYGTHLLTGNKNTPGLRGDRFQGKAFLKPGDWGGSLTRLPMIVTGARSIAFTLALRQAGL